MAGMLSPIDIASIIKNNMLQPISDAQMVGPYPAQETIPPPPNPMAPMAGGPPMPVPIQNDMAPLDLPAMPQAMGVNPMFQSQDAAPIPQEIPQAAPQAPVSFNDVSTWGPALNALGQFAAQIGDAQARMNLPADLYLKMKQQQNEVEMANQDRLLKNMQMEADAKYQEQMMALRREELALRRKEILSGSSGGSSYMQDAMLLMQNDPTLDLNSAYSLARSGLQRGMVYNPVTQQVEQIGGFTDVASEMAAGVRGAEAKAAEIGKEQGVAEAKLLSMQAGIQGLEDVTQKLSKLGQIATYTKAGQVRDEAARQLGLDIPDAAVARAEYIATVDNQVLPLLRETFGAAFTVQEGESLRATLGDANASPKEKDARLKAFIESKKREIVKLQKQTGQETTPRLKFNPETGDFE